MSLSCPLCSLALSASTLEAHLRDELLYPAVRCQLCRLDFTSLARAHKHFAGPLAAHPGHQPQLLDLAEQPEKEQRLLKLLRLASGGEEAVEKRLCVCGQCRLVCREPPASQPGPSSEAPSQPSAVAAPPPSWTWREPVVELAQLVSEQTPASSPESWAEPEDQQASPSESGDELASEAGATEEAPEEELVPKPASEGLKPGWLSCHLCGAATSKFMLRRHASGCHSGAEEAELVERCFGPSAAAAALHSRLRCKPCGKELGKKAALVHVARAHFRRPLHACRLCDYTSTSYYEKMTRAHIRGVHKRLPGPDTLDISEKTRLEPELRKFLDDIIEGI